VEKTARPPREPTGGVVVSNQKPSCGQATNGQHPDVAEFKAACERAIIEFVHRTKEERLAHAMPPHERGKLDSTGRILVINQGLLDAMASLLRRKPLMDCAPAVFTLIMLYSDNENGYATLGIGRIARLFSRAEDSIRNALDVLEACGLIAIGAPPGKAKRYWPVFDPFLATRIGHITWFADALAPVEPAGRPRKPEAGDATGNVVEFPTANKPPLVSPRGFSDEGENPPGGKPENPPERPWGESSFEFSPTYPPTLGADEHGLCNPNKWGLTAADYERWRGYADDFGQKRGAIQNKPHERDETDSALDGIIRSAGELYTHDVVRSAIPRLLDAVNAKIAKERREAGLSKGTGLPAMRRIAQRMMITECKSVREDRAHVAEGATGDASADVGRRHRPHSAPKGRGVSVVETAMQSARLHEDQQS
jgi:hypothetical protein